MVAETSSGKFSSSTGPHATATETTRAHDAE
jgi:hypothetical protein